VDYIPHTAGDEARMLAAIGVDRFEDLLADVPARLRETAAPDLAPGMDEYHVWERALGLAARNRPLVCFRGAGCYDHHIPSVVPALLSRSEFMTGYTPYQAELSQGMLTTIYEYQTHIQMLTGLDVASASMYDGASALAEAALMAMRLNGGNRIVISDAVHPRYREVVATYVEGLGVELVRVPLDRTGATDPGALAAAAEGASGVLLQNPGFFGRVEDLNALVATVKGVPGRPPVVAVAANPIALGLLTSPGQAGADIAVGEGQPLGVPMAYGGPGVGFFATRMEHVRQLPGRLVGRTVDAAGHEGFCLAFQTREQHIRRERATSNICSNQALLALANTVYLSSVGPKGITQVAAACHERARTVRERIAALPGWSMADEGPFFHEFVALPPVDPATVNRHLRAHGILGGADLGAYDPAWSGRMLFCATERRVPEEIDRLIGALEALG
jgi:glycine cleavage system P protein (glycine dehydrogenase) subunit 1